MRPNPDYDTDELAKEPRTVVHQAWESICTFFAWAKHRILHKLEHIKPSNLLDILAEHGLALVVIILAWEIIEDVIFPILFIWLGKNVHPAFLAGAPAAWLICLHWLVVPLTWRAWVKFKKSLPANTKM